MKGKRILHPVGQLGEYPLNRMSLLTVAGPSAPARTSRRVLMALLASSVAAVLILSSPMIFGKTTQAPEKDSRPGETMEIDLANFTVVASPSKAYVGQEVTFFANASSDVPGSTLTFRMFYDAWIPPMVNNTASAWDVAVTGNPGHAVFKHTYTQKGNFTDPYNSSYVRARVYLQDNTTSTIAKTFRVDVNVNRAPEWIQPPANPLTTIPGRAENVTLWILDSDNDSLTVNWDFGDGSTASDILSSTSSGAYLTRWHSWNPVIIPSEMEYSVVYFMNVSVSDGNGHYLNSTSLVNVTVSRNWQPLISLEAFPSRPSSDESVTFNASVRDPEGDPITWYFDWGDGTGLTCHTPQSPANVTIWSNQTHAFTSSSYENDTVYYVTLYVEDALPGRNMSYSVGVAVRPLNRAPGASFINYEPNNLEIDEAIGYLNVTFSVYVADMDGDAIQATWDFGDGTGSRFNWTPAHPDYITQDRYDQSRNFTEGCVINITVTITDGRPGHEIVRYLNTTVWSNNHPPEISLAPTWTYKYGSYARPNEVLNITMKVTDRERDPVQVRWDFGDGTSTLFLNYSEADYDASGNITVSLSHAYSDAGDYAIHIHITDGKVGWGDHDLEVNASLSVRLPPEPVADAGPDQSCLVGDRVDLLFMTGQEPSYYNFTWTLTYDGQAVKLYGVAPSFTFEISGTYEVTLRVEDKTGRSATDTMTLTVLTTPIDELPGPAIVLFVVLTLGTLVAVSSRRGRYKQ